MMRMKFFTVPVFENDQLEKELNQFLLSHQIVSCDRQFIQTDSHAYWCICISYNEKSVNSPTANKPATIKQGKIDYKEYFNETDFALYAKLRDLRKNLAEKHDIPVYAIFHNDQLAAMIEKKIDSNAQLLKVPGIGEGKVSKFGKDFLQLLAQLHSEQSNEA